MIHTEVVYRAGFVSPGVARKLEAGGREARALACPVWVLELRHPEFLLPECPRPAPGRREPLLLCVAAVAHPSWRAAVYVLEPAPADLRCPCCLAALRLVDVPRLVDARGQQMYPRPFLEPRGD